MRTFLSAALATCLLATPVSADITVMAWNIKDLTANNLTKRLDSICSTMSNHPVDVFFILEVRSKAKDIGEAILVSLKKYTPNATYTYAWSHVGREGNREEQILVFTRSTSTTAVTIKDYGIFDADSAATKLVKVSASEKDFAKKQASGPDFFGHRTPFHVTVSKKEGGKEVTWPAIAAWHASGPNTKPAEMWPKIVTNLTKAGVAVVVGDFNFESYNRTDVKPTGTTQGSRHYDDAVLLDRTNFELTTVTSAADKSTTASDHQWIKVTLREKRKHGR